jgi:hypothetical protein
MLHECHSIDCPGVWCYTIFMCSNRHTGGGRRGWAKGSVVMNFRMDFELKNEKLSTAVVFPRPCCFFTTCYDSKNNYESANSSDPQYSYDSQNNSGPNNDTDSKNVPALILQTTILIPRTILNSNIN